MPAPKNLIHEISVSTGTGNLTLAAVNGKVRFSNATYGFGTGGANVFDYFISNRDAAEWERGTGSMSAANTLVRDTVIQSSNADAAVNFSAGTKDVTNDVPAGMQSYGLLGTADNAAVRKDGTTADNKAQASALLIADTTGALSRSGGGGIPIEGTNTNDAAAAGYVGQEIASTLASGSAISLTTATPANVTSIELTAGDWDVSALGSIAQNASTSVGQRIFSISATSATLDTTEGRWTAINEASRVIGSANPTMFAIPPFRISLASTTIIYLVAQGVFAVSTMTAYGTIKARRVR